jgi:hypothetical protein
MKTNTINIQEITVYSGKDEICISGRMQQEQFSYDTCSYISSTLLNKIINYLQKINQNQDVCSSFSARIDPEGNQFMWLNSADLEETTIPWELLLHQEKQLRIRA